MLDTFTEVNTFFNKELSTLRKHLSNFIGALHPLIKEDVMFALKSSSKIFSTQDYFSTPYDIPPGRWSLLPLLIIRYISPETNAGGMYSVAVAIECFICALDLLDDVEDADQSPTLLVLGTARALNASTALLALTNQLLLSSRNELSLESVIGLLNTVQNALLQATTGQHRDIIAEKREAVSFTTEECIQIAEGKAGALMSLACSIGAQYARADSEAVQQFAELGKLLGIAHQLDNDSHDLYHILYRDTITISYETVKSDIERQKKTLPIVLAAHEMSSNRGKIINEDERQTLCTSALHRGIVTTWGISLLYRERAYEQLKQIETNRPVPYILRLLLGFTEHK